MRITLIAWIALWTLAFAGATLFKNDGHMPWSHWLASLILGAFVGTLTWYIARKRSSRAR
jgi:membrane protein DedA with SNARE-associated domain